MADNKKTSERDSERFTRQNERAERERTEDLEAQTAQENDPNPENETPEQRRRRIRGEDGVMTGGDVPTKPEHFTARADPSDEDIR